VSGTSVDYWPVTAKQGEVHHSACSNANPNHNTNPNLNPNPNPNPTADHRSRIRYLSKKNSRILTNFRKLKKIRKNS